MKVNETYQVLPTAVNFTHYSDSDLSKNPVDFKTNERFTILEIWKTFDNVPSYAKIQIGMKERWISLSFFDLNAEPYNTRESSQETVLSQMQVAFKIFWEDFLKKITTFFTWLFGGVINVIGAVAKGGFNALLRYPLVTIGLFVLMFVLLFPQSLSSKKN